MFCDLNLPLPFDDDSIAFTIGLDTFHRFNQSFMLSELMRVVKTDGIILFPHVHLSNNEPEPFFERGCKQRHGKDYAQAFEQLSKTTNWDGYIFSEPFLFSENDIKQSTEIPLISTPNTLDYNALIAFLPKSWGNETLSAFSLKNIERIRVIS